MAAATFRPSPLSPRRTPEDEARDRDLGFGSVVSGTAGQRLLNRDGSFNAERVGLAWFESAAPYHRLLTISWPGFLGLAGLVYLTLNFLFALVFLALGREALAGPTAVMMGGVFGRAFFFSVETFATIGYGHVVPNGIAANVTVTFEALVGLMYQALATGLLFARFSRPTASILFSRRAVIGPYRGGSGFMFRIINRRRGHELIELSAQVLFSALETESDGRRVRRYIPLPLERNQVTFFPLSWTIVHPIDEHSPLFRRTADELVRDEAEVLVLLSGTDQTFEQTVHARSSYQIDEIVWDARFKSIFVPGRDARQVAVDVRLLHEVEVLPEEPGASTT